MNLSSSQKWVEWRMELSSCCNHDMINEHFYSITIKGTIKFIWKITHSFNIYGINKTNDKQRIWLSPWIPHDIPIIHYIVIFHRRECIWLPQYSQEICLYLYSCMKSPFIAKPIIHSHYYEARWLSW